MLLAIAARFGTGNTVIMFMFLTFHSTLGTGFFTEFYYAINVTGFPG